MKKISFSMGFIFLMLIISGIFFSHVCFSAPLSGSVEQESVLGQNKGSTIVDSLTGKPVGNATVGIPSRGIYTRTDGNGHFSLNTNLNSPAILSVKANGYRPFSLTVSQGDLNKPLMIGISKESGKEIIIDSNLHHLGDNNFSEASANASDFRLNSGGSFFSKEFMVENFDRNSAIILKIGSVIGLDTDIARRLGQNRISTSMSSPTRIYINSQKVGELRINGDNQEISIPASILMPNSYNQITIETGRNIKTRSYVDYDDMEFMNLILDFR